MIRTLLIAFFSNFALLKLLCNKRGDTGAAADAAAAASDAGKTFTAEQVNGIVQERLARERGAAPSREEYDALAKFKADHETAADAQNKLDLEQKQEYDKLKTGWEGEKTNFNTTIAALNQRISGITIDNALNTVVMENNAFPDSVPVLREHVAISDNGVVQFKGKDQAGNQALLDLAAGAKTFFTERPHLVKATNAGGGSGGHGGAGDAGAGGGTGGEGDLTALNLELQNANAAGNFTLVKELKGKINAVFKAKGINRTL